MDACMESALHRAVGLSDMASLCSAAFAFPTPELAAALEDGAFLSDWRASLLDACGVVSDADEELAVSCGEAFRADSASYEALRREYSRMYLTPGGHAPVWIYEGCFRHRASGATGVPALFRSPIALSVSQAMHDAGVAFIDERREPCDSAFREFDFLAYLHAACAEALRVGDGKALAAHRERLRAFASGHALLWMPSFMDATRDNASTEPYGAFARLGKRYLEELEAYIDSEEVD
ncbi:MAG: molecular chaperone TorD family protein [Slackia sp.]|nr:molecular chaperone TorD family protein [Slackia sp.]